MILPLVHCKKKKSKIFIALNAIKILDFYKFYKT